MSIEGSGQKLVWINNFKEISEPYASGNTTEQTVKLYKGQWRASDMNIWEGFGIIKFADGSLYEGQTRDGLYNGKGRMTHINGDIY